MDRQFHFWNRFLFDLEVTQREEADFRLDLGVLGDVDNGSGDAMGRQYLRVAVAFAAPVFRRA